MNKLQVQSYNWVVQDGYAFPIGKPGSQFISFLEPGTYEGRQVEPVWQYKKSTSDWWDNLDSVPNEVLRAKYDVRLLIREVTSQSAETTNQGFQYRVQPWLIETFGAEVASNIRSRAHRFLEEALELAQSLGCTIDEVNDLKNHVYSRPKGDIPQEIGGVMVTLAGVSLATGNDMQQCGDAELADIWTKIEQKRNKEAMRPKNSAV